MAFGLLSIIASLHTLSVCLQDKFSLPLISVVTLHPLGSWMLDDIFILVFSNLAYFSLSTSVFLLFKAIKNVQLSQVVLLLHITLGALEMHITGISFSSPDIVSSRNHFFASFTSQGIFAWQCSELIQACQFCSVSLC